MIIEVKVPALAESIADATVVTWLKKVGDFVSREEHLTDLETDKVTLEVTAPEAGVLKEIKQGNGKTVHSNDVLAVIDTDAKGVVATPKITAESKLTAPRAETKLGPAARKIAQEQNVDTTAMSGSGRGGRVTKEDVLKAAETPGAQVPEEFTPSPGARVVERVPMTRLRTRIAERLKQAQNTAAMLTTFNEVNMQPVMGLRDKYKERFLKEFGVKLGFMSFFTKACIEALKKFPVVNASVDANDIVYHGYFDIGIAVGTERGLVVPVIHDADHYTFAQLETKVVEFGQKARDGKLSLEELSGGTFTITNGGVFGSLLSTPILNPPQSAILGMHKIQDRPVVENGQIVARPMMYIALSYDHRIIDGQEAVQFLVAVKEALEDPARMLLQI